MASGDEMRASILQGSAEVIECPCSLCLSRDKTEVEAEKTCVDCNYNMCAACADFHTTFPSMASHQVVDVNQTSSGRPQQAQLPKQRCQEHGRVLDKYCKQHDQLACDSCVGVYHSTCGVLEYIPAIAIGTTKSKDFQEVQKATKALLKDLNDVKSQQQAALKQTDVEEANAKQLLQDVTKKLHTLTNAESGKVDAWCKRKKASIQKTIKMVDDNIEAAKASDNSLRGFQGDNESELFIHIKQGQKCERDGKDLLQQVRKSSNTQVSKYTLDVNVERALTGMKLLDRSHDTFKIEGGKEYNIRANAEILKSVCDIKGVCLLPDASFIVTDWENNSLKRLDTYFNVTARMGYFFSMPHSVCLTKNNEIAVTFTQAKKVRIFSVGAHIEKTRSFSVGDICRGICHSKGELFVCCGLLRDTSGGHIRVFDMTGSALRTIQTNTAGQRMFSVLGGIAINSDGTRIYVTDRNRGMLALDRTGKLLASYSEPDLESANGICLLEGEEELLVSGRHSHNIHHVTRDGRRLSVVHGLVNPFGLCYDLKNSRLVVATDDSDTLKVFDLHVE